MYVTGRSTWKIVRADERPRNSSAGTAFCTVQEVDEKKKNS